MFQTANRPYQAHPRHRHPLRYKLFPHPAPDANLAFHSHPSILHISNIYNPPTSNLRFRRRRLHSTHTISLHHHLPPKYTLRIPRIILALLLILLCNKTVKGGIGYRYSNHNPIICNRDFEALCGQDVILIHASSHVAAHSVEDIIVSNMS